VFAAKASVPFIGISYADKMDSFGERLQPLNLLISVHEISSDKVISKFVYVEKHYDEIKKELKEKTSHMIKESQKTTEIIKEQIDRLEIIA
jgi:polysaccharide pyruvyl transferase WcaK-like protein